MELRSLLRLAALATLAACAACARPPPPPSVVPRPPAPPPEAKPPAPPCAQVLWIEVTKSTRRLEAACAGGGRVAWTVALGRLPGAKRAAGDHRTPEGLYHVVGHARKSRFHLFLSIDYPSLEDAERARGEGRLGARDFARIAAAHERGARPPADTPLGGDLGFHGEGERWRGDSAHLDWTYGCLAMADETLDFLVARTAPGTPVRILP